jgi:hypothetical protein
VKIPTNAVERQMFYADVTRQCLASRSARFDFYKTMRNYYLFGTADESGAPYNKIESTIDTLSSFIYSPEGVRFTLQLGVTADANDVLKAQPLSREIAEQWRMTGTHIRFGLAAKWASVFGCMLMQVKWRRGLARTYLVEPHQFGVLREDILDLNDQEAFAMCYTTTRSQLYSDLEGNPRRETILERAGASTATEGGANISGGMSRLLLSNPVGGVPGSRAAQFGTGGGTINGGLAGPGQSYNYAPRVDAELIDMVDLYVWDDEAEDYQIVTMASPDVIVYDRQQKVVGVSGMPHFVVVRANNNLYDYFWGDSYVARLTWLQDWRTEDVYNIRNLQAKQSRPPVGVSGMVGIAEEKLLSLTRAGGITNLGQMGKAESFAPKMPENIFGSLDQIDRMFDDVAGLGHILQGKGESGVRSKGQADLMARLGSSRPKQRAIVIEESAEEIATLMLRSIQEHSETRFQAETPAHEKITFVAAQFTQDFEVKVDAHSSSPIFVEDRKHDASQMLEAHVIDRETFLEMYDPPNLQELKERLKVIERKEAEAQKLHAQMEAQKDAQKHGPGKT